MTIDNKPNIYDNAIQPSGGSGSGGTDPADKTRITNLENNESKVLYYEAINSSTGTITKPTDTTILLNDFPQGYDAVVETIVNGEPTGQIAKTSGGTPITVTSFDTNGNYTLSGTPASFPVALLYILRVKALYYTNLTFDNIVEAQNFSVGNASDVVFTPNGDIAAMDVQSAIVEVRDDTDIKLLSKAATNDVRFTDIRFQRALAKDINTYTSTSTTAEELLAAIPVGAGIVIPGDFLEAVALVTMPTNGNNKNFRIYISPTSSFSDPNKVLVAFAGPFTNTTPSVYFRRKLIIVTDTTAKIWIPPGTNYYNDDQQNSAAITATYTLPSLSAGFYFLITSQKTAAVDVTRLETFVCELIR